MGKRIRAERGKSATSTDAPVVVYWHGGADGLEIGDVLRPSVALPSNRSWLSMVSEDFKKEYRPDFAYITTDQDLALDYGISHAEFYQTLSELPTARLGIPETGALYGVQPRGRIYRDPDYPEGISFRCTSAVIVSVLRRGLTSTDKVTGASYDYRTWDDDSPLYDSNHFPLPNKAQAKLGVTPADLRLLGSRAEFARIQGLATKIVRQRNPGITQSDFDKILRQG